MLVLHRAAIRGFALKILFVSSEVAPFAKTGGLGDVSASLPRELARRAHDVRIVLPFYARIKRGAHQFREVVAEIAFELGPHRVHVSILQSTLPGSDVPVYFVRCPSLYDRPYIYGSSGDEHLRFAVLCWATLKLCQYLQFAPDVVHANDWQSALLPLLLKTAFAWDKLFAATKSVLTIHNIGHQGTFPAGVLAETGLGGASQLVHQDFLQAGHFGYLLTGILHANAITTVSPTYAREIQTEGQGVGLHEFLRARRDVLFGILNGIDETEWNPNVDPHIPSQFGADNLQGKEVCKAALVRSAGLSYSTTRPVVGIVSRLAWQKGFDLCMAVLPRLLRTRDFQLLVLGTGEPAYEEFFRKLARAFPTKVAYQHAFSEKTAHLIEAGADMFLMPSRYEPCGLNQMYSLCYGTVPIVHRTGGLADTVSNFDERSGRGNGVSFEHFDESGLQWAIERALRLWGNGAGAARAQWRTIQQNGMRLPFGWRHRIGEYEALYRKIAPDAAS
jgi:starch synthase